MEKENKNSIAKKVTSKIEGGEVEMKPRLYFLTQFFLWIVLIASLSLITLYVGSLIIFTLRVNGIHLFRGMGTGALRPIISSFPWFVVALLLVLVFVTGITIKKSKISYKKPLIYSFIAILTFTLFAGFLVDRSSVHDRLWKGARQNEVRLVEGMYRRMGNIDIENAYFGSLRETEDGWTIVIEEDEYLLDMTDAKGRRMFLEAEDGDKVLIIGEVEDEELKVYHFKRLSGNNEI